MEEEEILAVCFTLLISSLLTFITLQVTYEDGEWHKPYYDCGGGNIWMMTYTVPFFGYDQEKEEYFFKSVEKKKFPPNDISYVRGTSGLDIDLRVVDINQCHANTSTFNIFGGTDKCKKETTQVKVSPRKMINFNHKIF